MVLRPPLHSYTHPTNEENLKDVLNMTIIIHVACDPRLEINPMMRNQNTIMNMTIIINVACDPRLEKTLEVPFVLKVFVPRNRWSFTY